MGMFPVGYCTITCCRSASVMHPLSPALGLDHRAVATTKSHLHNSLRLSQHPPDHLRSLYWLSALHD